MAKPVRVVELDILRAVAIIVVIVGHFDYFLPTVKSNFIVGTTVHANITLFGVALFLFISGFVLYLNHPSFSERNELTDFLKKGCSGFFRCIGWQLRQWLVEGQWLLEGLLEGYSLLLESTQW